MFHRLLALLLLGAIFSASAQSIYSWKDASGRVHYSDTPPPDARTRTLRQAPLAPSATPGQETYADKEQAFRKRRADAAEADEKARRNKAEEERKEKQCAEMRRYLIGINGNLRLGRYDDNGDFILMSDDERAAETEKTRASIERNCN